MNVNRVASDGFVRANGPVAQPAVASDAGVAASAPQRPGHGPKRSKLSIEQSIQREFAASGTEIPAHEIKGPTGGGPSKGTVILFHPGGWGFIGQEYLATMEPQAQRWRDRGFTTLNTTYAGAGASEADAIDMFDAVNKSRMGRKPTITTGASAGGQLSLMVAAKRPKLDLAISQGGPLDLVNLPPGGFKDWVDLAWGPDVAAHSPVQQADAIKGRVLLGASQGDTLLMPSARTFKQVRPQRTTYIEMAEGDKQAPFIHANVDTNELPRFLAAEETMAAKAIKDHYKAQGKR